MTLRKAALLAALGITLPLMNPVMYATVMHAYSWGNRQNVSERLLSLLPIVFDFLLALALALFFAVLYGEASGRVRARTRAFAALVAGGFMVLRAGQSLSSIANDAAFFAFVTPKHSDYIPLPGLPVTITSHLLGFLESMVWVAFLVAFSRRKRAVAPRATPTLAGVLAILIALRCLWGWYLLFDAQRHLEMRLALPPWKELSLVYVLGFFVSATSILFFLTVWRRWKPDLPVHENLVAEG